MDLDLIRLACKGNQNALDKFGEICQQAKSMPDFAPYLISLLRQPHILAEANVHAQIQIALLNQLRSIPRPSSETPNITFWTQEYVSNIFQSVFKFIVEFPSKNTIHLIPCLRLIIQRTFPYTCNYMHQIMDHFSQGELNQESIELFLNLVLSWSEPCDLISEGKLSKYLDQVPNLVNTNSRLCSIFNQFISTLQPNIPENEGCVKLMSLALYILFPIVRMTKASDIPMCDQLLRSFMPILTMEQESNAIQQLKRNVAEGFSCLLNFRIGKERENLFPYSFHFQTMLTKNLLPFIFESLQSLDEPDLQGIVLHILYQFFYFAKDPSMISLDLITNVLLPFCRLTEDDIENYEMNPSCFLARLDFTQLSDDYDSRTASAEIIASMINISFDCIEPIFALLTSPPADAFDFEVRLFLLTKYTKVVSHNKKTREFCVHPQFLSYIFNQFAAAPAYVQPTILLYLTSVLPYTEDDECLQQGAQLAFQVLSTEVEAPLVYCASKLLVRCLKRIEDPPEFQFDLNTVITQLLHVTSLLHYSHTADAIIEISKLAAEQLGSIIEPLASQLLEEAIAEIKDDSTYFSSSLSALIGIIDEMNDDDEFIPNAANTIWPFVIQALTEYPETGCAVPLLALLSRFTMKLEYPTQVMLDCLPALFQILLNQGSYFLTEGKTMAWLLYPLVPIIDCDIMSSYLFTLLDLIKTQPDEFSNDLGYCYFMVGCMIQQHGERAFPLFERVLNDAGGEIVENEFQGYINLFASALVCNHGTKSALMREFGVDQERCTFFQYFQRKMLITHQLHSARDFKCGTIVSLAMLVLSRDPRIYKIAVECLLKYSELNRIQMIERGEIQQEEEEEDNEEDDDDDEVEGGEEEEEVDDDDEQEIEGDQNDNADDDDDESEDEYVTVLALPKKVPIDDFDVIALFREITSSNSFFDILTPKRKEKLQKLLQ